MLLWQSFGLAAARNKADFVLRLLLPLVASGMFVAILYKTGMPVILIAFGLSLSVCAGIFCAAETADRLYCTLFRCRVQGGRYISLPAF